MFHPDPPCDGQRNCPKHVEFYSKNKFEKLVHLVGFTIRIDGQSSRVFNVKQASLKITIFELSCIRHRY